MNGRQMADPACAGRSDLKALFITGYAENAVVGNGHLEAGMRILTKPFTIKTLAGRIRELIIGYEVRNVGPTPRERVPCSLKIQCTRRVSSALMNGRFLVQQDNPRTTGMGASRNDARLRSRSRCIPRHLRSRMSVVADYLRRSGVDLNPSHHIDNFAMGLSLVASTRGIALLPTYVEPLLPWSVVSRPLKGEPPTIDLAIGYSADNASPTLKNFLERADRLATGPAGLRMRK